jgi:hypothetical protein
VHFYSFLCESVLGKRPAIRLMYLRSGETITATPTEQSVRFITTRTTAVWKAVEKACTTADFRRGRARCATRARSSVVPGLRRRPDRWPRSRPRSRSAGSPPREPALRPSRPTFDTVGSTPQLEPWRDRRGVDRVFHRASEVGDFSLVWQVIGAAVRPRCPRDWRPVRSCSPALIGLESLIVNQGIKRLFRRTRPTETGDPRSRCASRARPASPAVTRRRRSSRPRCSPRGRAGPWAPLWFAIAASWRSAGPIVRIHHPSDVVGGAVVGLVLVRRSRSPRAARTCPLIA